MATYSVYNIKVDNQLSFTPGPTAGYVLAIDANGNTYWSAGSSGGSQTLAQTLALGNSVGTYSITSPASTNLDIIPGANAGVRIGDISGGNYIGVGLSATIISGTTSFSSDVLLPITSSLLATDASGRIIATSSTGGGSQTLEQTLSLGNEMGTYSIWQKNLTSGDNEVNAIKSGMDGSGFDQRVISFDGAAYTNNQVPAPHYVMGSVKMSGLVTQKSGSEFDSLLFASDDIGTYSRVSLTPAQAYIQSTKDITLGANGDIFLKDAASNPYLSNTILAVNSTGKIIGTTSVATKPIRLTSQTLLTTGWFATGSYYGYTFSNANIGTSSNVDFIPYNDYSFTVLAAGVQPYILPLSGSAIIYSQYIPSSSIVGDFLITPTI